MKLDPAAPVTVAERPGTARPLEERPWWRPLVMWAVAGMLLVAVVLRFVTKSDLWLDEALSVNISRLPLKDLHQALKQDGAPPLYYLLLHGWISLFGTSDLAVRSLSGVIGVITLPVAWFCGRRMAGVRTRRSAGRTAGSATPREPTDTDPQQRAWLPWATVLVVGFSPYAIRYSTETRMYGLEILLVLLGYLALRGALDGPRATNLVGLALVTGLLLYTQYWALYLIVVIGAALVYWSWRGDNVRNARLALGAVVVGCITWAPWIPTFLYQTKHTGTPWGRPVAPPTGLAFTFLDFAGSNRTEGWLLVLPLLLLAFLAVFGRAVDRNRIELDVRTVAGVRWEALVAFVTLLVGLSASFAARSAFQSRYAAIMFGLFALVVAYGTLTFSRYMLRVAAILVVVVLGFAGGMRNVIENRTQAFQSADLIKARSHPGDVVIYCPDQVGPDVSRLLPASLGLEQWTFPGFQSPTRVNWIDYAKRNDAASAAAFARQALARAGSHDIWYVYSTGYRTYGTKCEDMITDLAGSRTPDRLVAPDDINYFEYMGLVHFPARP